MNLVEIYVKNITKTSEPDKYGFRKITADTNSWGYKQYQKEFSISPEDYESVLSRGFYLG